MKPFQVKNHMWIFVNALIENPAFDSQTKEFLTLKSSAFGSKCELSEDFVKKGTCRQAVPVWRLSQNQCRNPVSSTTF